MMLGPAMSGYPRTLRAARLAFVVTGGTDLRGDPQPLTIYLPPVRNAAVGGFTDRGPERAPPWLDAQPKPVTLS